MLISQRTLRFGPHTLLPADGASQAVPYFLAGRNMYFVGMITGDIVPIGAEHLVGEMGGLWAHPVKLADGMTVRITDADGVELTSNGVELIEQLSHIEWRYQLGDIAVQRRDFIAEDQPASIALLTLTNTGAHTQTGELHLAVSLKFLGNWFGGTSVAGAGAYWRDGDVVVGLGQPALGPMGVACGTLDQPARCEIVPRPGGSLATLSYALTLAPGAAQTWEFMLVADHAGGSTGARQLFRQLAGSGERLLQHKIDLYERIVLGGVVLETPDQDVNRGFALAKANLHMLQADYRPQLPPYFLAGIPEYPQLFGCDTEYSVPGAVAAGFAAVAKSALLALAGYGARACGRIPHEITTNGRVFHPGNTQETPQFVSACWEYFSWTGDLAFLQQVYPLCQEGIDAYMPALWGGGGMYPIGDGVVERPGMGARKLDSTCYLFAALRALRDMATALEQHDQAARYQARLTELQQHFEQDWWLPEERMYADSLHTNGTPQLDGHWTVVLPLQLGLASVERARASLARIEREWVNQWGLVHTRGREESVWTLPTGLLALTAFRYEQPELGISLLQHIAETASYGTLGAFKELIPVGLCFVQLWSAGLYTQGIIEGLFGLQPLAHLHRLLINPQQPAKWPFARIRALEIGAHVLDLAISHSGIELQHRSGPAPLTIRYRVPQELRTADGASQLLTENGHHWLETAVPAGQRMIITLQRDRAIIELAELIDQSA